MCIYICTHMQIPTPSRRQTSGQVSRCWCDRNCWGEVALLNVPGTRGEAEVWGSLFCAHPHTNVQPESRELVVSAHQRGRDGPIEREWSREEGSGEIQEGISEEKACNWASVERLGGGLSRRAGSGPSKRRVQLLPTSFFIPSYLAFIR